MDSAVLESIELPEGVEEALQGIEKQQQQIQLSDLQKITGHLIDQRQTCIDGRTASGIQGAWQYCEDAYIGIDAANRHEYHPNRWLKPPTPDGNVSQQTGETKISQNRSTVFPPLTRRYVNAAAAKLWEIVNDPEEMPFETKATPVPDTVKDLKNHKQVVDENGEPQFRDPTPKEMNPGTGGTPEHPLPLQDPGPNPDAPKAEGKPLTYAMLAQEAVQRAEESAKAAGKRIHDQMVEGRFAVQDRRCIRDGAKLGTGIIKGPIPDIPRSVKAYSKEFPVLDEVTKQQKMGQDGKPLTEKALVIEVSENVAPIPEHVSVWDFYPDPACGENIQNGGMVWERRDLTKWRVQKLAKMPGYSKRALAEVLKQQPKRITDIPENRQLLEQDQKTLPYEAWFFYCQLTKEEFKVMRADMNKVKNQDGDELEDDLDETLESVHVQGTMINDMVVHLVQQPNEKSGEFPYNLFVWTQRDGSPFGVGIAEQGMPAQRIATGAVRRMIDNAGFSSGAQIILDPELIEPAKTQTSDNPWEMSAYKYWWKKQGSGMVDDMRKAMTLVQFPSAHDQLSWIVEWSFRLFEESTNIPLISQGFSGDDTPETLGQTQIQDTNANQMLRDVAENHDYGIIVSYVQKSVEWNLLDPNIPDEEKLEVKIFARGSTAFMDRYIQRQVFQQYMPMIIQGHNILGINPGRAFEEMWRANRMNPKAIQYTEQEKADLAQQPPPEPVQVQVEKIRAQLKMKELEFRHQQAIEELKMRREIAEVQAQTKLMEYANDRQISMDQAKTELAKVTMQLNTQVQISSHNSHMETARQVAKEGTEPPGKAPDGEAFEK